MAAIGPRYRLSPDDAEDSCNGVTKPKTFDCLDHGTPVPTGTKAKNWPVIYAENDTLNQVIVAENGQMPNPQLTATATAPGTGSVSLTLTPEALLTRGTAVAYLSLLATSAVSRPTAAALKPLTSRLSVTVTEN
jgi:hypothetical protein